MTNKQVNIIELAKEVGAEPNYILLKCDELERFAALVRADRELVDLTDDEIFDAYTSDAHENTPKSFARAVVAAFKEKNK